MASKNHQNMDWLIALLTLYLIIISIPYNPMFSGLADSSTRPVSTFEASTL